jgi:formate dehydrogenase subunit delta
MSAAQQTKLASMARGIADFFRAYPPEQAALSVADHINRFWTPRMREELKDLPAAALDPLVVRALPAVRSRAGS